MTSIKDVAIEAGVSTATVSRVLTNKPYITQGVRERVELAVQKLGYRPNQVARSLRSQQSTIIGLIVSDICNPFFSDVSRTVEDCAYDQGYSVFLCNSDGDEKKELTYLYQMVDKNVAGVIFSPTKKTCDNFDKLKINIPMVVYDRTVNSSDVDSITIDNIDASYNLTKHLISNGYRRIAGIFCNEVTGLERREGFEKALREANIVPHRTIMTQTKFVAGYNATIELFKQPPVPDAIFATDNLVLEGSLQAIHDLGLSIPNDVGLAGFDDVSWMKLVNPTITVVRQPTEEIGRMSVDLMMRRIEEPTRPPIQVRLKSQLIIRESTVPDKKVK